MSRTGPYRDTLPAFLKDHDKRLQRLEHRRMVSGVGGGGTAVEEVWIGPTEPTDPNIKLWFNTTTDILYARDAGAWVPTGGGGGGTSVDEVYVGVSQPNDPTGLPPTLELWYDPDAPSGMAWAYTHVQSASASVWTIDHNLGFNPNIQVIDSSGANVEGDITYPTLNRVVLTFSGAFTGTAYLS